jgi:hypothetical protein
MTETIYCKPYEYFRLKQRYNSRVLFNESPRRKDIVDSVFCSMQLFRADIDYDFVKSEVEKILDKEGYSDPDMYCVNPHYNPDIEIIIEREVL